MSEESTRSTTTNGQLGGRGTDRHENYPGQKLDKTLSTIREGLPRGPEKTPGGHGQVWREL